jgi:hypothetical protein
MSAKATFVQGELDNLVLVISGCPTKVMSKTKIDLLRAEIMELILTAMDNSMRSMGSCMPFFAYPAPICVKVTFNYIGPLQHFQCGDRQRELTDSAEAMPLKQVDDNYKCLRKAMLDVVYLLESQIVKVVRQLLMKRLMLILKRTTTATVAKKMMSLLLLVPKMNTTVLEK